MTEALEIFLDQLAAAEIQHRGQYRPARREALGVVAIGIELVDPHRPA